MATQQRSRDTNRLTATKIAALKHSGSAGVERHHDGGGLYFQLSPQGGASWVLRFKSPKSGKLSATGLGRYPAMTLAMAREEAAKRRTLVAGGTDPVAQRKLDRRARERAARKARTFEQCAEAYIKAHEAGWTNAKHAAQWRTTLDALPFKALWVNEIDTDSVQEALAPLWAATPETASRLRGRIEHVLDWAKVKGLRTGENPARWKGHLSKLLAAAPREKRIKHHPALPYKHLGAFMADLRGRDSLSARALEFLILTAARTNEVIGATWAEIDTQAKVWTIPAERMKAGRQHTVPLSDAALRTLEGSARDGELVFPLSNMAMLKALARMNRTDNPERAKYVDAKGRAIVPHGFRSTFRDWAGETTAYPRDVCEMALAHAIKNKVEAAYRRGDLLEKRRSLMDEWARYCAVPLAQANNVTNIRAA